MAPLLFECRQFGQSAFAGPPRTVDQDRLCVRQRLEEMLGEMAMHYGCINNQNLEDHRPNLGGIAYPENRFSGGGMISEWDPGATETDPHFRDFAGRSSIEWRVRVSPDRDRGPASIARPVINPR